MARRSLEADRLEELLSGDTSPGDASRQLARLASLATTVREHAEIEAPSADFKARLRADLLATAAAGPEPTLLDRARDRADAATARWRHSLRVAGASAVAATMIGTTGVAAAAQSALPGDMLYSIKGFTEDARLAFASGDLDRGRLHLAFARERLEEVELGRDRLTPAQFIETLDRLDTEAAQGADEMLAAALAADDGQPILDELDAFTAEMRARLLDVSADLPLSVRPATERSLEVLRRIDLQINGLLASSSCEDCGSAEWLPRVVLPGDGPAVPDCNCVGDVLTEVSGRGNTGSGDDAPLPGTGTNTVGPVDPYQTGGVPSDGGSGMLGDVGDAVDDTVDDTVNDLGTTIDDTVNDVGTTIDDVSTTVDDTVSDVGTTVDDVGTTVDDTVSDVSTTVDDTVSDVGTTVDDTVDDVGTLVDDLLGSSETQTDSDGLLD